MANRGIFHGFDIEEASTATGRNGKNKKRLFVGVLKRRWSRVTRPVFSSRKRKAQVYVETSDSEWNKFDFDLK